MASPSSSHPEMAKGSVSNREKRQPWQSQMSDVDFQLSLLAKYAGIEFHPHVLEIIVDLIRMNVSIPMLAKMIKLMCAQKAVSAAQAQAPNSVNSQNGNTNNSAYSIPSMDTQRNLIVSSSSSSSAYSPQSSSASLSSSNSINRNAVSSTPKPTSNTRNFVTSRVTRTKTAPRILKK